MILFNSPRFLCCLMSSFGVSATSSKKSLSLICLQHQPLSLFKVEIATIWNTILDTDVTLLGRISSEDFVMLIVIFVSSFCCCSSFAVLHSLLFMGCCTSFIAFQRHRLLFFHSFTASGTILRGHFFTHRRFLPYAPSPTFYLGFSRPPWEPVVLPWSLQGLILILETQTRSVCLFDPQ